MRGLWLAGLLALGCLGLQLIGPAIAIVGAASDGGHSVGVRNLDGCVEVHLVHPSSCSSDPGDLRTGTNASGQPIEPDHVLVFGSVGFWVEPLIDDDLPVAAAGFEPVRVEPMERMAAAMLTGSDPARAGLPARWRGEVMRV